LQHQYLAVLDEDEVHADVRAKDLVGWVGHGRAPW
jgi:hypothetical protein